MTSLAGCDLLTISPALLAELEKTEGDLPRKLDPQAAKSLPIERIAMDKAMFEKMHKEDRMATDKLKEGIEGFSAALEKLEGLLAARLAALESRTPEPAPSSAQGALVSQVLLVEDDPDRSARLYQGAPLVRPFARHGHRRHRGLGEGGPGRVRRRGERHQHAQALGNRVSEEAAGALARRTGGAGHAASLETAVRAVEYGAYRYLTKPVDIEALATTVRGAAELGERTRRSRAESALPTPAPSPGPSAEELSCARAFEETLVQLWVALRPIVSYSKRRLHGYEALSARTAPTRAPTRSGGGGEARPAHRPRPGHKAKGGDQRAAQQALLLVNLHARDLGDPDLVDPSAPLSRVAGRVVLEVTERTALEEVKDIHARVDELRKLGFRLALDDLGAGYAGLASFASIEPDVVKLDMSLVRGVDVSPLKQTVVRSVVGLAGELRIEVISEDSSCSGTRRPHRSRLRPLPGLPVRQARARLPAAPVLKSERALRLRRALLPRGRGPALFGEGPFLGCRRGGGTRRRGRGARS